MTKPEDVNFTLTVTLPLKTWKEVASRLETERGIVAYPLQRCIHDLVSQAQQTFWPSAKATQDE
jgi:hypothetical protein